MVIDMPKKKKHPRLPNGYGQIRYLGKGRSLPYAVHPPATERNDKGDYIRPKALCYVPDWYTGFAVLSAYHSGMYKPGLEIDLTYDRSDVDGFIRKLISHSVYQSAAETTLQQAYDGMIEAKFGQYAPKELSKSSRRGYEHGWNYLKPIASRPITSISVDDLQQIINDCPKKQSTKENISLTIKQIFKYAMQHELCEKDPSRYLVIPAGGEDEHGVPFSDDEIKALWSDGSDTAKILLMMIYSGFRIGALRTLEINLGDGYFRGGIKTKAGKNRIVPIHSGIMPMIKSIGRIPTADTIRINTAALMRRLGMKHTPHDCRHTFSALCERYGVNEADRKRMLGHSFGSDITNGIYGHRTLDDLREQIEKIKVVGICDH